MERGPVALETARRLCVVAYKLWSQMGKCATHQAAAILIRRRFACLDQLDAVPTVLGLVRQVRMGRTPVVLRQSTNRTVQYVAVVTLPKPLKDVSKALLAVPMELGLAALAMVCRTRAEARSSSTQQAKSASAATQLRNQENLATVSAEKVTLAVHMMAAGYVVLVMARHFLVETSWLRIRRVPHVQQLQTLVETRLGPTRFQSGSMM